MRRWSSGTIRNCAASPSLSRGAAADPSSVPLLLKQEDLACGQQCQQFERNTSAPTSRVNPILKYRNRGLPVSLRLEGQRLPMKIGNEYRLRDIGKYQWQKLAPGAGADPDAVTARIAEIAGAALENIPEVTKRTKKEGLDHPLIDRLAKKVTDRA